MNTQHTSCIDHGLKGNPLGYGRTNKRGKNYLLHRLAYCKAHGLDIESISDWLVLHSCDNTRCINPDHLRLGTHKENMRDRASRNRVPTRRLTDEQVKEIRETCAPNPIGTNKPNPFSYRALARKFDVDMGTIRQVHLGITFTHLLEGAMA